MNKNSGCNSCISEKTCRDKNKNGYMYCPEYIKDKEKPDTSVKFFKDMFGFS